MNQLQSVVKMASLAHRETNAWALRQTCVDRYLHRLSCIKMGAGMLLNTLKPQPGWEPNRSSSSSSHLVMTVGCVGVCFSGQCLMYDVSNLKDAGLKLQRLVVQCGCSRNAAVAMNDAAAPWTQACSLQCHQISIDCCEKTSLPRPSKACY